MSDNILSVDGLMMHFGGIKALSDVNFSIKRHSISALIGPNGALLEHALLQRRLGSLQNVLSSSHRTHSQAQSLR